MKLRLFLRLFLFLFCFCFCYLFCHVVAATGTGKRIIMCASCSLVVVKSLCLLANKIGTQCEQRIRNLCTLVTREQGRRGTRGMRRRK